MISRRLFKLVTVGQEIEEREYKGKYWRLYTQLTSLNDKHKQEDDCVDKSECDSADKDNE